MYLLSCFTVQVDRDEDALSPTLALFEVKTTSGSGIGIWFMVHRAHLGFGSEAFAWLKRTFLCRNGHRERLLAKTRPSQPCDAVFGPHQSPHFGLNSKVFFLKAVSVD